MAERLFEGFDFALLDAPDFKEDSVREEFIVPLLKHLGYSASGNHRIIRSKSLIHPYVYIGTQKNKIYIIPDYLLQFHGENFWILDAKAPNEKITTGKNVEQAFSYAIHKDIRVKYYALCNGRKFVLFHVSKWPPIIEGDLANISNWLPELEQLLGTYNASKYDPTRKIKADFGLYLAKSGLAIGSNGKNIHHLFPSLPIMTVGRVEDDSYTISSPLGIDDIEYMATFDFGGEHYQEFLAALPDEYRNEVAKALSRQPYHYLFQSKDQCLIGVACQLGDTVHTNEDESYCPLIVEKFF